MPKNQKINFTSEFQKFGITEVSENANTRDISRKKRSMKVKYFHQQKVEKDKRAKKIIAKKSKNDLFEKVINSKIKRIKRRTLHKVELDKYRVRDTIKALRGYFMKSVEEKKNEDLKKGIKRNYARGDKIIVKVMTTQKMDQVTIKPIQM